ncbi:unnamed protein product [Adineta steineri]|uniref:Uncharacterized protein n=1 Tax=Adineta steineri TaxID=433720 RepID=A0A813VEY7_9BILA|nr:unnamed protein product [Adineta steineri]CAF3513681.1 unnamed protein product [Adineta steineri]
MMKSIAKKVKFHKADEDNDTKDPTAPFYELQAFDSIWQALRWREIRTRVPTCFKKTIHSRYMLANLVFLGYAIGMLIIDFNPSVNGSSSASTVDETSDNMTTTTPMSILDQSVDSVPLVNHLYIGFAIVHILSAFLYWWAWRDHSWLDIIMIPEYLNHIEAGLYLWSSIWYSREDTLGGYYTLAIHRIELAAAIVELIASFGWIMSWYLTYIRTLGRGFTLDDPDTIAYSVTTIASIIYLVYNIQINISPEQYGSNYLYTYADILYFISACFYIFAALRDDHWFWFLPMAGQYGIAPGKIHINTTKILPSSGKPSILMTDLCRQRRKQDDPMEKSQTESNATGSVIVTVL